jgi:hypothetical protein
MKKLILWSAVLVLFSCGKKESSGQPQNNFYGNQQQPVYQQNQFPAGRPKSVIVRNNGSNYEYVDVDRHYNNQNELINGFQPYNANFRQIGNNDFIDQSRAYPSFQNNNSYSNPYFVRTPQQNRYNQFNGAQFNRRGRFQNNAFNCNQNIGYSYYNNYCNGNLRHNYPFVNWSNGQYQNWRWQPSYYYNYSWYYSYPQFSWNNGGYEYYYWVWWN